MREPDFDHASDARLSVAFTAAFLLHVLILAVPAGDLALQAVNAVSTRTALSAVLRTAETPNGSLAAELPISRPDKATTPLDMARPEQPEPPSESSESTPQEDQPEEAATALGVPLAYYRTRELSKPPQPITPIPDFSLFRPDSAEAARLVLRLFISDKGVVERIQVENTELSEEQSETLKAMFLDTRFSPGILETRPVPTQMRIEVLVEPYVQP